MTTPPITPPITRVTGGVGGLTAAYAEARALADRYDHAGDRLRGHAAASARVLVDADLVASAPLSPITYAEAETRVLDAASGLHGALETSIAWETDARLVRAAVTAYAECDRLVADGLHALDYAVGLDTGLTVSTTAPLLVALGLGVAPAWQRLPLSARRRLGGDAEEWLAAHPGVVQRAADASGGFLDGLGGPGAFHPTVEDAASELAGLYPREGEPRVRRRTDLTLPSGAVPPGDLRGLVRHLEHTNALSTPDRPHDQGTIEIQTLTAPDGGVRHVVYLPGTDDLDTPWHEGDDVRDVPADLHVIAGDGSTYAAGIEQAMHDAGIGPTDPVLLVGHSLGGMEAASLLAHGSGFHVTHVVTVGSPIGGTTGFPPGTHVLSLENAGDVVPLLDGRDNPDSVEQVTVRFDDHETSIVGNHDLAHYVRGAAAADVSTDPSVREQLGSLRLDGFLGAAGRARSQVFQISR